MNHSLKNPNNFFIKKFFILRSNLAYSDIFFAPDFCGAVCAERFAKRMPEAAVNQTQLVGKAENAVKSSESGGK
ncbi:MAG TPA: hypothetical protein VK308_12350 [Pyrinomonadaceae bacterium]|nr:hypothetical protein [Pyrinomonadaceae bacterium]